jgi:hypothetical protein
MFVFKDKIAIRFFFKKQALIRERAKEIICMTISNINDGKKQEQKYLETY